MDDLQHAIIHRARSALDLLQNGDQQGTSAKAKAFSEIAWQMLGARYTSGAIDVCKTSQNSLVQKAVAHALGDDVWAGNDARALAASYLRTIAPFSLLDQIKLYARVLPAGNQRVLIAADAVANVTGESYPIPVVNIGLSLEDVVPTKAAGIVVLSKTLAETTEGKALFESELQAAVLRASNLSVLAQLEPGATAVASTGDGPLADLRAGLVASGPAAGYVVAMPAPAVVTLSTSSENRGNMGVRGGEFVPGVHVVAIDGLVGIYVIPASRLAIFDGGLQVRSAGETSLDMRASPTSPSAQVSLFQTNSVALLCDRTWHLAAGAEQTVIVGG